MCTGCSLAESIVMIPPFDRVRYGLTVIFATSISDVRSAAYPSHARTGIDIHHGDQCPLVLPDFWP